MATSSITYIATVPRAEEGENPPSLIFDAVVDTSPTSSARLSKYSISDKSEITNHRVRENPTLQITAWMGRSPLTNYSNNLVSSADEDNRPSQTLTILDKWDEDGTELYISNEYKNFTGYVITKLDWNSEGTDSIKFTINLEKARRVTYSKGILIQNMDTVKSIDAQGNTSKGTTDAKIDNLLVSDDALSLYTKYLTDGVSSVGSTGE